MVKKTIISEINWIKKAPLAKSSHERFSPDAAESELSVLMDDALKYEIAETREATKASNAKKCPICPGNKCSPSNFMSRFSIE